MSRDIRPEEAPRGELRGLSLAEFIPKISPNLTRPDHFKVVTDVFERAIRGDLRIVFSAPVQHGKTTLVEHAIPWWHAIDETLSIFYVTYAQQYTEIRSRNIRRLTGEVGCRFRDDHKRLDGWSFDAGGRAVMTSVEGPGTGLPGNIFAVDDPFKGPAEAYSKERRDLVHNWYRYVLTARRAPRASHFVIASRWDDDDLSGRLIQEGYTEIRLPAICDSVDDPNGRALGAALCPWGPDPKEPRDLAFLESLRRELGPHAFDSLCQGKPSPRSGQMFRACRYYDRLPDGAMVVMCGVDIATSEAKTSDFACIVALAYLDGIYYVHKVWRVQRESIEIEAILKEAKAEFGSRMAAYVAGPEKGIYNLMFHHAGIEVERMPARYSKWVRAQKTAIAWNTGRIIVRENQPWTKAFVREINNFTGAEGAQDDQVDALVGGYDAHESSAPVGWAAGGFRFGKARG